MEEDMDTDVEVLVHECTWTGSASYRNWSQADHVLAELLVEMCWIYWIGCRPVYRYC
jgi:hypothetical protein